jgi:hypothetical protein
MKHSHSSDYACPGIGHTSVSDTNTTPTLIITFFIAFPQIIVGADVSVSMSYPVSISMSVLYSSTTL